MTRILNHVGSNLVAYIALFVALGGTSYAAISIPADSVGTKQIRNGAVTSSKLANGSITPAKLDARALGGSIRNWAHVSQTGQVLSGSRGAHASVAGDQYTVAWGASSPTDARRWSRPPLCPASRRSLTALGWASTIRARAWDDTPFVWTFNQRWSDRQHRSMLPWSAEVRARMLCRSEVNRRLACGCWAGPRRLCRDA